MRNYKQYTVWEAARSMTTDIYRDTCGFPESELFGLVSQLRRACISIAANIAEGCGRDKEMDLARFLDLAMGSAKEVECLLIIANDLGFLGNTAFQERQQAILRIQVMIASFLGKISR